jgi:hypothetical protein
MASKKSKQILKENVAKFAPALKRLACSAPDEALIQRLQDCKRRISDMCKNGHPPKMSIPARPDHDDDLVICQTIDDAITALSAQGGEQSAEMVSVPREPTKEMLEAAYNIDMNSDLAVTYREVYQAMLFAAPRNLRRGRLCCSCADEVSFARQRIREFDNCIQRVAAALDAVCGGVDDDQADIHSTTSVLLKRIAELKALTARGGEQTVHWKDRNATEYVDQTDMVRVPREPTEAMIRAGNNRVAYPRYTRTSDIAIDVYESMLAAAKEGR